MSSATVSNTLVANPPVPPATSTAGNPVPAATTLINAAKLAIQKDMAIQLDYFVESASGTAFLGEDAQTSEKMLVKNSEEYTSHIQKIYKAGDDFIIMTENSIYIVSGKIQKRKIQASSLKSGDF
jgi:hypothetical protein